MRKTDTRPAYSHSEDFRLRFARWDCFWGRVNFSSRDGSRSGERRWISAVLARWGSFHYLWEIRGRGIFPGWCRLRWLLAISIFILPSPGFEARILLFSCFLPGGRACRLVVIRSRASLVGLRLWVWGRGGDDLFLELRWYFSAFWGFCFLVESRFICRKGFCICWDCWYARFYRGCVGRCRIRLGRGCSLFFGCLRGSSGGWWLIGGFPALRFPTGSFYRWLFSKSRRIISEWWGCLSFGRGSRWESWVLRVRCSFTIVWVVPSSISVD